MVQIAWFKVITSNLLYIIHPLLLLSRFFLTVFVILTAPLLHLGSHILYALYLPFHILTKFETLYIFFGVAILVGFLTGTSLHYVFNFLISGLRIESLSGKERGLKTITELREERKHGEKLPVSGTEDQGFNSKGSLAGLVVGNEADQDRVEGAYKRAEEAHARAERKARKNFYFDWVKGEGERGMERGRRKRDGRWGRKGVLASTILEEDDSSDVGF